jgi:hypothetical protein
MTVSKLSVETTGILFKPEMIERFRAIGSKPLGGMPADVQRFCVEERVRWEHAAEMANYKNYPSCTWLLPRWPCRRRHVRRITSARVR